MSEMRLSEAVRLGAMMSPKGIKGDMGGEGRCALAAASDAAGVPAFEYLSGYREVCYESMRDRFPILRTRGVVVDVSQHGGVYNTPFMITDELTSVIYRLNDSFGWSREQIADLVETIERRAEDESVGTKQETAATAVSFAQK